MCVCFLFSFPFFFVKIPFWRWAGEQWIQETEAGLPNACALRTVGSIGLHKINPISSVRWPNNKKLCVIWNRILKKLLICIIKLNGKPVWERANSPCVVFCNHSIFGLLQPGFFMRTQCSYSNANLMTSFSSAAFPLMMEMPKVAYRLCVISLLPVDLISFRLKPPYALLSIFQLWVLFLISETRPLWHKR